MSEQKHAQILKRINDLLARTQPPYMDGETLQRWREGVAYGYHAAVEESVRETPADLRQWLDVQLEAADASVLKYQERSGAEADRETQFWRGHAAALRDVKAYLAAYRIGEQG